MSWLRDLSRWFGYAINPIGGIIDAFQHTPDNSHRDEKGNLVYNQSGTNVSPGRQVINHLSDKVHGLWDDYTGKTQVEMQNEFNREMAEEEYQRNIQSIGDTAAAYEAAGLNRNLLYGSSSPAVNYSAPNLQAYSGSKRLDAILSGTSKVLSMLPAMYQATAALEGIDQARERTKQSEIKTMSMGMSLLDQGYRLGDSQARFNWVPQIARDWFSSKRHFRDFEGVTSVLPIMSQNNSYSRYADAALKNQFELLNAIGIKNAMNSTLNSWRGYQYDLDRRFGAAGRIVGMTSQGLRSVGSLFSPIDLMKYRKH